MREWLAEKMVGKAAGFYERLMQGVAKGILVLNDQGIITFANPMAITMLGFETGTPVGRPVHEFLPDTPFLAVATPHRKPLGN